MTNDIPKPDIPAYIISLAAAPKPVTIPYHRPLFSVRWTQRIPTGPIGALAITPINIPLKMKSKIFIGTWNGITPAKLRLYFQNKKKTLSKMLQFGKLSLSLPNKMRYVTLQIIDKVLKLKIT
jgi:hypothetical protein